MIAEGGMEVGLGLGRFVSNLQACTGGGRWNACLRFWVVG
jgi:hypothetical protein